jgi:ABC-type uncharacterized transport system auxiliary subunit
MRRVALLGVLAALAGCFSPPPPPPEITYYRLEGQAAAVPMVPPGSPLRLRHVRVPLYLDDRVVWRSSDVRVGFHAQRRWCEAPGLVVERALARALFARGGFVRAEEKAPVLEVEVDAFEEITAPRHEARVALDVRLVDAEGHSLPEVLVEETRPVPDDDPASFARAMDAALAAAVTRTVEATVRALGPSSAPFGGSTGS